ncbi:MAG: DUF58 domain-containing protein [Proteobacteria bacterium]|nr:DUF58 domain-containing protein [Pseudomonadota bacterium]
MLSPEIIQQIKKVQFKAGHLVTTALAGNYLSAFKGRGMEFDEVREYVPGDDVRLIDWNVTARMSQPYVKVLREERELTLMLMVDVSPSQAYGSSGRRKQEVAAELAAVLAYLAIRNNDKVGLIVFSDHVEQYIPPKKGRGHVWNIIRAVLTHKGAGRRTDISGALDSLLQHANRRSMCFLISDFWASDFDKQLRLAARRHDLVAVRVSDPREHELPDVGMVALQDSETGDFVEVDTSDSRVRSAYQKAAVVREKELLGQLRKAGVGTFAIDTVASVTEPLVRYLRERERRRYR